MPDSVRTALIVAAGAFIGSILGNIVRPVLEHFLDTRAQKRQLRNANAEKQFVELYKPLYDYFNSVIPPDSGIEYLGEKDQNHVIGLFRKNRHLADPELERIVHLIEDTMCTGHGEVDYKELGRMLVHVEATYNRLRQQLGLPYETALRRLRLSFRSAIWKVQWRLSILKSRLVSRFRKHDDEL